MRPRYIPGMLCVSLLMLSARAELLVPAPIDSGGEATGVRSNSVRHSVMTSGFLLILIPYFLILNP